MLTHSGLSKATEHFSKTLNSFACSFEMSFEFVDSFNRVVCIQVESRMEDMRIELRTCWGQRQVVRKPFPPLLKDMIEESRRDAYNFTVTSQEERDSFSITRNWMPYYTVKLTF